MANSDYPTSIQVAHLREHRSGGATGRPCAAIFCLSITAYVNSNICSGGQDRGAILGVAAPAFNLGRTDDTIWSAHLRLLKADMAAVMTAGGSVYSGASIAAAVVRSARECKLNTLLSWPSPCYCLTFALLPLPLPALPYLSPYLTIPLSLPLPAPLRLSSTGQISLRLYHICRRPPRL